MLQPQTFPDHETLSQYAADWLLNQLRDQPKTLFCLATGATPTRTYELFAARRSLEPKLFDRLRVLKLDEWGGLAMDDPATCEQHLRKTLIEPLGLVNRYVGFQSRPDDPVAECKRIQAWLDANGPIDVCVLGLGVNGHIGFNEPAPALRPHAHIAELSAASLGHAMLNQAHTRPAYGLTLGMADLLHSRLLLLLVSGSSKREPLRRLLDGPIITEFPASLLVLHPNVLLLCDEAAMG